MAVSLHGLRYKIAAAAVLKFAAARAARLPAVRGGVLRLADLLQTEGEPTGSYRGLAAGLLRTALDDATEPDSRGEALVYDPVAGLVPGAEPEAAPDLGYLRTWAEQHPSAGNLMALAAAYRKSYVADFHASAEAYEQAFAANPKDLRGIEGILVSGARSHYDWPRIWRYASTLVPARGPVRAGSEFWAAIEPLYAQHPSPEEVTYAEKLVADHEHQLSALHQLLIESVAVRFQFLGSFQTGTRLRRIMAANRVKELRGIPLESALWLKHLLGAYAYLEDEEKLRRTVQRPLLDAAHPAVRRQMEKLRADAALWQGEATPLQSHALQRDGEVASTGTDDAGERMMREMVAGHRVAVVGPAAGEGLYGELIDSYDVVVRTNLRRPLSPETAVRVGGRTDISYYAGLDLVRNHGAVQNLVESGSLALAVTRPHCLPAFQPVPPWLRIARFEFGLYYRGAPMGIQRILYDLLQYAPAEIALFHADFYAGDQATIDGYRDGAMGFGPDSQANDPVVMHDLSFEFRLTQRLADAGLVSPHGAAAAVLSLNEQEYLARLEARNPLR